MKGKDIALHEVIYIAKNMWMSGRSNIQMALKALTTNNFTPTIKRQHHLVEPSLKKMKKDTEHMFSNNYGVKSFILEAIHEFEKIGTNAMILWYSYATENKLILVNFSQLPTGNWIFNKYIYSFSYFEIEVSSAA